MCFAKKPDIQQAVAAQPAALPAPSPTPVPSESSQQSVNDARKKRLEQTRYGLSQTIKTSPSGITGSGPNLSNPYLTGKNKLGV